MATVTPYNVLGGTPSQSGTWTFVSGPSPNPSAPATWNGTVVLTEGVNPFGDYTYRYTVTNVCTGGTQSADVVISYGDSYSASNDECTGAPLAMAINSHTSPYGVYTGTNKTQCPGETYTISAEAKPASWPINIDGDAWFKINYFYHTSDPVPSGIDITIDGGVFGPLGADHICAAVYEGATCGGMTIQDHSYSTTQSTSLFYSANMNQDHILWVRVSSELANSGKFDIIANVIQNGI